VVGDEPVAAVADLDPYAGIANLDDEAHARSLTPFAVLDGVGEQLADEQPDGEPRLGMLVQGLQAVDGGPGLSDRRLGRR